MTNDIDQPADTLIVSENPKDSRVLLDALNYAERDFRDYNEICRRIDATYSARSTLTSTAQDLGLSDQEYDTFWSSMEVLKPAIYAKAPQVVAKPRFSDASPVDKVVAELIERVVNSEFERSNIDMELKEVRDDLALLNRGVLWVTYEVKGGRKSICVEHLDRLDYRHEPVRYWRELGWEARCAWMTQRAMKDRFEKSSGDAYTRADFVTRTSRDDETPDDSAKAAVWEVWSQPDDRVYWVSEGCEVILDEGAPHLELNNFFPGPRPAYGTLRRRSLIPVPDYIRYENHLNQINELTDKIYTLLDRVRVVGLIPAGGDVGTAIETAMSENTTAMFIPVPGAAMTPGADYVQWLPIDVIATTIKGLIEARGQLFADFDRLSGISDIMRGETEAEETLGAQRLKGQYGSVRVKDKTEEIVRLARDAARVAVEIICDKFDQKTLLEISQMDIPAKRDVERDIEEIRKAARAELEALTKKAGEALQQAQQQGQQIDPAQAQQMLQQAQQEIAQKYAPDLQRLSNTVVIEDVMRVIKDKRDRALIIDIETDSTVMTDDLAEKQARNELLTAFSGAIQAMLPLFQIGEPGVKLAVTMLQFSMQPYVGNNRQIQSQLDELIENAPEIAAKMAEGKDGGDSEGLVEAQKGLAEAEKIKAQAAMEGVKARAAQDQASNQVKIAELQQNAAEQQAKAQQENGKLQLQLAEAAEKARLATEKQQAEINHLTAQTAQILATIDLNVRKQDLGEYQAASAEQSRVVQQEMEAVGSEREHARAERSEERADRGQEFAERSAEQEAGE